MRDADDSDAGTESEDETRLSGSASEGNPVGDDGLTRPRNVWTRWDTDGEGTFGDEGFLPVSDLHLHRYCDVWPFDGLADEDDPPEVTFISGPARTALRHTPLGVTVTTLAFVLGAEFSPNVGGVSAFLPLLTPVRLSILLGAGVLWLAMAWLLVDAGLVEGAELLKSIVVYGTLGVLVVGTVGSILLVVTSDDPTSLEPNVVFTSGYLLMLYLGGLLVYDGMVRTERLFSHLDDKLVVRDADTYDRFKRDLVASLETKTQVFGRSIRTSYLFSPLFVAQFAFLWGLSRGPQNLSFWLTFLGNVVLDLFVVVVSFQFLVLVKSFHDLVTDVYTTPDGEGVLEYRPFHPDARGGFRDLGKFATRVNLLLILAGLYVAYRLLVQGGRILPTATNAGGGVVGLFVWTVSYVLPIVFYAVAASAWLYYSFWQIHQKMAREREKQYIEYQRRRRTRDGPSPLGSVEDSTDWGEIRNTAPVWPIRTAQLASIVSGSLAPIVFVLQNHVL